MTWETHIFLTAMPGVPVKRIGRVYRGLGLREVVPASRKGMRPAIWALTHIGTGHRLVVITGGADDVERVATEIAEAGEWAFVDLEGWRNVFPEAAQRINEIMAKYPAMFRVHGRLAPSQNGSMPDIARAIAYANLGVAGAA